MAFSFSSNKTKYINRIDSLPSQELNNEGIKILNEEKYNLEKIREHYENDKTNIIKQNALKLAQLKNSILLELQQQNLQIFNNQQIYYSNDNAQCDVCFEDLIDINGQNQNWRIRTCGHIGCNDIYCAGNNNKSTFGPTLTINGKTICCSLCRKNVRYIYPGGNNISNKKQKTIGRTISTFTNNPFSNNSFSSNSFSNNFMPTQVIKRVADNDDLELNEFKTDNLNNEIFKSYLTIIENELHQNTAVLQTEVIELNDYVTPKGFVIIVDISGSMQYQIPIIIKSLINQIELLSPNDFYSLIVFDDTAYTIISFDKATPENKINWKILINSISSLGSTSYTSAIIELQLLLNEIKHKLPNIFEKTRILIMGDGDGDLDASLLPQLHQMNIYFYGITIGNDINVDTIKLLIGTKSFDQGNYRHFDYQSEDDLTELLTSMDLMSSVIVNNVTISVENGIIDNSNAINNDNKYNLIYKYHGPGIKQLRITNILPSFKINVKYNDNINSIIININDNQEKLIHFCSYRNLGNKINEVTDSNINQIISSINEQTYGEFTCHLLKLFNTKKEQLLNLNNDTYTQNYTQNTIASLSARATSSLPRQMSNA